MLCSIFRVIVLGAVATVAASASQPNTPACGDRLSGCNSGQSCFMKFDQTPYRAALGNVGGDRSKKLPRNAFVPLAQEQGNCKTNKDCCKERFKHGRILRSEESACFLANGKYLNCCLSAKKGWFACADQDHEL